MFNSEGLQAWLERNQIPETTRTVINAIRTSPPSRRVGGGSSNVCGRYPSKKMGATIQFESHRVELAGIYEMEHDSSVREYYDQPAPIKLTCKTTTGRELGVWHTPDFFVIRDGEAGWEEWKTEEELQRLTSKCPNRYSPKAPASWDCPPGRAHAEPLGLYYRVRSSAEIDWTFQRNIQFLDDYLRADQLTIPARSCEMARATAGAISGIHLDELLHLTGEHISADTVFSMIAANILYVDLYAAPLAEPSRVLVYSAPEAASVAKLGTSDGPNISPPITFRNGNTLIWDTRIWKVINAGDTSVGILSEDGNLVELPRKALEDLAYRKKIALAPDELKKMARARVFERLSLASEDDLRTANSRSELVRS